MHRGGGGCRERHDEFPVVQAARRDRTAYIHLENTRFRFQIHFNPGRPSGRGPCTVRYHSLLAAAQVHGAGHDAPGYKGQEEECREKCE